MKVVRKPNFLIVGAAKAGTTSLAKYLNEHPQIFIPEKKELRYFVSDAILALPKKDLLRRQLIKNSVLNKNKYYSIFQNCTENRIGEASVHYLFNYEEAIPKIKSELGDIPIIIILRNPVTRAISNWYYNGKDIFPFMSDNIYGEKHKDFDAFWKYKSLGLYSHQVKAYLENFSSVKIILFEDFVKQTNNVVNEIVLFLGQQPVYPINTDKIYNKHIKEVPINKLLIYLHKNEVLFNIILKLKKRGLVPKKWFKDKWKFIDIENESKKLHNFYLDDINTLEKLINKDLSDWKKLN